MEKFCSNCKYSIKKRFSNKDNISNYYCTWYKVPKIINPITGKITYIWKNQTKKEFPFELCSIHNSNGNCSKFMKKENIFKKIKKKLFKTSS